MLHVQNYLRSGKTLQDLRKEHGVSSYIHNGKISLTYDMLEAKESDPLSQQCRGLILRENTFDVVAAPLFRFFNLEQKSVVADVDWKTASIEEKLDGTLIITYFDHIMNKWCVGTRSRPEADGSIDGNSFTFHQLFNLAIQKIFGNQLFDIALQERFGPEFDLQSFMKDQVKTKTYCFELCTPVNRIVCAYDSFLIRLLAVRDNISLKEESPVPIAKKLGLPNIPIYQFSNLEDLILMIRKWDPMNHEGVVVKDSNFNRLKIKSPAYTAYNHIRDKLSTSYRGCLQIVILEKDDDISNIVPEFINDRIRKMKTTLQGLIEEVYADYDRIKHLDDQKMFAEEANKCNWPGVLFQMKKGKITDVKEWLQNSNDVPSFLNSVLKLCIKVNPSLEMYE